MKQDNKYDLLDFDDISWRSVLLLFDSNIKHVIDNFDKTNIPIALIVNHENHLIGTITDGDIRRALLRGLDLNSSIETVIHTDAIVVPPYLSRESVKAIMLANKIRHLPIVNDDRYVIGLHQWEKIVAPQHLPNLMVIMAGGRGTRLYPHTRNCPKPLLPVSGKPILQHVIERAKLDGFRHFVLAVHYLGHMIEEYFGDGTQFGVEIDYLHEKTPLGTAGALGLLDPQPVNPVIVTNGDVLTDIRYDELLDFHIRYGAVGTMAVRLHEWTHPFGVVQTKGVDIVGFEEKPVSRTHINAGVYVLEPDALGVLTTEDHCDMPTLFERLKMKSSRIVAYPMHEPWLDVGRPEDLVAAGFCCDDKNR